MTMPFAPPINYDLVRKTLVDQVQYVTGLICILSEPEQQNADRPQLPYVSMKIIDPGVKVGDDAATPPAGSSTIWNIGGQRKVMVDFNFYGRTHEEAYTFGALWQASLESELIQGRLRAVGIAVWLNAGPLRDLSELLNTGYEGRALLEVSFGIASNIYEDRGAIEEATITGTIETPNQDIDITIQGP